MKNNPLIIPAVILWVASAALAFAYLNSPSVTRLLDPLLHFQVNTGAAGAFANRIAFCAILPALFWLCDRRLRPPRPWVSFFAQALWSGGMGIVCEAFFNAQAGWFGADCKLSTLVKKTVIDQFVWTVLFITPMNVLFYSWAGRGFSVASFRAVGLRNLFRTKCRSILISNWCVWIPVIFTVYSFPTPLQIQISGFVCAFWSLMCFRLGEK